MTWKEFFLDVVNEIREETLDTADSMLIGPPTRGQEINFEEESHENLVEFDLTNEVAREMEVIQYTNTYKCGDNISTATSNEKNPTIGTSAKKKRKTLIKQKKLIIYWNNHILLHTYMYIASTYEIEAKSIWKSKSIS